MGGGQGAQDARTAAELNQTLFSRYAAAGAPPLKAALGYTRGALAQGGLPGYVEKAYRQAGVGALEQQVKDLSGLRRSIAARGDQSQMGGQYVSGMAGAVGSAGDALTRELAGIRVSRAVAGLEQRNKLLNVLAGGAATGTSLSAGFGNLANRGIALEQQPDQTYGLVTGGLSTALGLYGSINSRPPTSNLGFYLPPTAPNGIPNVGGLSGVSYT